MLTRFFLFLIVCAPLWLSAQTVEYTTPRPRVDDANDEDVVITRIDLTAEYTIISMRFRGRNPLGSQIHFVPTARLYANGGARSFRFVKAANIPTVERMGVDMGKAVDFVAYFERLDPGITEFDLFECSDRGRINEVCFNFWGVHVINPLKRTRSTPPPVVAAKPAPVPAPKTAAKPRTTPIPAPRTASKPSPKPAPAPPVAAPPAPVLAIKGAVRDAKTGQPVVSNLTYRLMPGAGSAGRKPDSARTSGSAGTYQISGAALSVWDVMVSAKGYFGQRDTISMGQAGRTVNFDLVPIVAGTKITLRNIYFEQSKYELQAESYPELDRLVLVMRQNPTLTIRLEGHTDIIGDFDANVQLSRSRVQEVKRYLTTKGIAATRVDAVGYGHSRPIVSAPGKPHPENRRVEMVVTKA